MRGILWLGFQGGLSKAVKYNLQKRMARVIVIAGRVSLSHLIYHTAAADQETPRISAAVAGLSFHSANLPEITPGE